MGALEKAAQRGLERLLVDVPGQVAGLNVIGFRSKDEEVAGGDGVLEWLGDQCGKRLPPPRKEQHVALAQQILFGRPFKTHFDEVVGVELTVGVDVLDLDHAQPALRVRLDLAAEVVARFDMGDVFEFSFH